MDMSSILDLEITALFLFIEGMNESLGITQIICMKTFEFENHLSLIVFRDKIKFLQSYAIDSTVTESRLLAYFCTELL